MSAKAPGMKNIAISLLWYCYCSYAAKLNHNGSYTEHIHRITRIQNELGMSKGEISFMYNKKHQFIRKLNVVLTTKDGKKYSPSVVQDSDAIEEGMYSDFRKKIIMLMLCQVVLSISSWRYSIKEKCNKG